MREANSLRRLAKARYAEIVKQYPNTRAAREAQELLDK
jgi:TolA-binding protein